MIAGELFHVFQQRRIFDVLQLTGTTDSRQFNGSGNMITSLVDFAKWDKALWDQDSRLLSKDGYKMIFTQGTFDNGNPVEYGFGWQVKCENGKLVMAEHGGGGSGTTAARNWIQRHFKDDTTIAFFAQEHPDLNREARLAFLQRAVRRSLKSTIIETEGRLSIECRSASEAKACSGLRFMYRRDARRQSALEYTGASYAVFMDGRCRQSVGHEA